METKIYEVDVKSAKFWLVDDDKNGYINFVFTNLAEAKKYAYDDPNASQNAYGLCMGNDEVISYGRSVGFIKNRKLVE